MNDFLLMMAECFGFLKIEMNVYGFTFSFWDVILFSLAAGLIIKLVMGLIALGGDD